MSKIWTHTLNPSQDYYAMAQKKFSHEFHELTSFNSPKAITDFLNNVEYDEVNYVANKYINLRRQEETDPTNTVELPFGCYKYGPDNYPMPERFEVIHPRVNETYIELEEVSQLKKDARRFIEGKDLYEKMGFIHRRGYLLYGAPGNGKTALIRSMLSDPVFKEAHIIWASDIPTNSFCQTLNTIDSLKIVIFEEITNNSHDIAFDLPQLLNFMDGENSLKNCITIATTNYPEFLHQNLADRPSRFDVVMEIKEPSDKMAYMIFEKLLDRPLGEDEIKLKKYSFAQIKEIVLLHKLYDIPVQEAADMLNAQSQRFKDGFQTKGSFGLRSDD